MNTELSYIKETDNSKRVKSEKDGDQKLGEVIEDGQIENKHDKISPK
jgi:hypothetical protein